MRKGCREGCSAVAVVGWANPVKQIWNLVRGITFFQFNVSSPLPSVVFVILASGSKRGALTKRDHF
jgi:hypothetical protein